MGSLALSVVTEYAFTKAKRNELFQHDRAVLLAHGAGADMNADALVAVADALRGAGVDSLRFNYPYRTAGKRFPDRPEVLLAATREAAVALAKRTKLDMTRIVLGGRSMGGRYCSLVIGDATDPLDALGLVLLAYPLHAPGRPHSVRDEHFHRIRVPVQFVSGTNDSFGSPQELKKSAKNLIRPPVWHWIKTADHGFKPRKRETGATIEDAHREMSAAVVSFVNAL